MYWSSLISLLVSVRGKVVHKQETRESPIHEDGISADWGRVDVKYGSCRSSDTQCICHIAACRKDTGATNTLILFARNSTINNKNIASASYRTGVIIASSHITLPFCSVLNKHDHLLIQRWQSCERLTLTRNKMQSIRNKYPLMFQFIRGHSSTTHTHTHTHTYTKYG